MAIRHALVLGALGCLACGVPAARAQSLDELYAKAKSEGAFAFYVGGPTAPWETRAKAFEDKYPGVKISIGGGFSNVLDKKVDAQLTANKLEVDAAILQTAADFVRWKHDGALMTFRPPGFDKMDPAFKDKDGTFWATMVNVVPYMYNTDKVAAADVPNSARDFLKPQFHGKIVTAYPADDDVTLWVFYHIVRKYGWGYMDKYMAAKPSFIQGHLGEQRSIASGQNIATFDSILDITSELKRQGQPVDSHIPTVDALPIWPLSGAIFKYAPHPNAAKLFLSWLLSPEQQSRLPTWSPRSDVAPPAGYKPILAYKVANDYRAFLTDQRKVAELRKRFEKYTGPVVNAGGVR
ncbi:MAG TPA: extracellular solute-binding protein [Xanthobacteraceae bacterium]|nr:extracellular solute-binding protein [Xanthobacteraceae bacterium]